MTHEEILQLLYDETLVGNAPAVRTASNDGLADGMDPERMLYDALIPSLEEVGARFERGDYFVPEMLIAARAMQGALDILRPLLAETGTAQVGTFLIGTVKGDVHDIGKNLCNIMLEGAGFTVIDLGVNVPPERFIEQIERAQPRRRRLLGLPDDDDADVQGEHQRAREGRPARQGDRDGRRRAGHPGVRRRRRRRRLLGRRLLGGQEGQGADRAPARDRCRHEGRQPRGAARARRQGAGLGLQDVRPVRPARHRADLPDDLPEDAAQRPCGGVRADGHCEVMPEMRCVWVKAYERSERLPLWRGHIDKLRPPVDNRLEGTSSWVNLLSGRDREVPAGLGARRCRTLSVSSPPASSWSPPRCR